MTPEEAGEKAESLFKSGFACSQAVLCTFADELGLDETTALKISLPFGGGMGRMREVCGCVSGMLMVCGLKYANGVAGDTNCKDKCYAVSQELAGEFKKQNGSIICRELLGLSRSADTSQTVSEERTAAYYQKRPCAKLAALAAEICCRYISSHPVQDQEQ